MATTGEQMESGYKKIHRWCQFEFRQYTREGQLEVGPVMKEAVVRLRQRPALLDDAMSVLTSTRQSSTLQSFLDALTRGGPGGLPRPIELHAHDPTRYVGDMLAWIHQTTASEHEFLESLFGAKEVRRMVGETRGKGASIEEQMVQEALDKDLEGLGRPLKVCAAWTRLYIILTLLDAYPTDDQKSRRSHYGVQDCESFAILPCHHGQDYWCGSFTIQDSSRVSSWNSLRVLSLC
jgi:hypothetical protein